MNPEQGPGAPLQAVTPAPPLAPVPAPSAEVTAAPPLPALPPEPSDAPPVPPKKNNKLLLIIGAAVALVATAAVLWLLMDSDTQEAQEPPHASSVALPKEATVTAECVAGRGKQYILPKDIPIGPIYDVHQGKVIAVEYLIGQKELSEQSDMFANLGLPEAGYNHLAIVPTEPHAGLDESHFHAIAYLISADEAKKITCDSNMPEDQMH